MTTIFDYSITAPTEELVEGYHPYPPHLANYERVYRNSTDHGELSEYRGKPLSKFFKFLDSQGIGKICVKARDIRTTFDVIIPNEAVAGLVADYPDRVIGFAGADPHRGRIAVTEFEHAIRKQGLRGLNLVGGDVVEVSPPFDMSGNTALVGVTMMWEILCLLAEAVAKRKGRL